MHLQHLISYTAMVLIIFTVIGCVANSRQQPQSSDSTNTRNENMSTKAALPEICKMVVGSWRAFQTPKAEPKRMCGDLPCGYRGPFDLECQGGIITGSALLAVDSREGKVYRAPIEASWAEGKLVLKYTNNQKCLITYTVSPQGEKLVGEYSKHCDNKEERGDFLAMKFPLQ